MPNWNQVLTEIESEARLHSPLDKVRRKYLKCLSDYTKRNVIAYYSGWIQKPNQAGTILNDSDINGFMTTIHQLDRDKGLDLIIHTPGGDLAALEAIVNYLREMFDNNIRAFVPQLAMSAGTMLACSCNEIFMGKHSNLGPIDPQYNGISADGVIEEFRKAIKEIKKDPAAIEVWKVIIGKYHPTFIGDCEKAIKWSKSIVTQWLKTGMFCAEKNSENKIKKIVRELSSHKGTYSHSRHMPVDRCKQVGLKIKELEEDSKLQDYVLTVHHTFMHTFAQTPACKIIENHNGQAMVLHHREKR